MKWYISILFIILLLVNQAHAVTFSESEIEWAKNVTGTLHKGGILINEEYTVKAVQFPAGVQGHVFVNKTIQPEDPVEPMVYLEIYRNETLLKEFVMTLDSPPYIDPDYEVKVSATGFISRYAKEWVLEYYDPWATIVIQKRARPKLDVIVKTDKTTYTSDNMEVISATVEVKNTGDTFIKKVDVNLKIGDLKLRSADLRDLHVYYDKILKSQSKTFSVVLLVPDLIDQKSYALNGSAKGYDVKDIEYNATGNLSLIVSPKQNYFRLSKSVKNRIYLQDYVYVKITAQNGGIYDIHNIHITDNMSDKFILTSSPHPFEWNITLLKPGDVWTTGYSIKSTEANLDGWDIPVAGANFTVNSKLYNSTSQSIKMVVNGPILILNKTVSKTVVNMSEDVTVTLSVNNIGNIGTKSEVIDSLPDDVSLVSGKLFNLNYSEPEKIWGFSYIIRMNREGEYELPSAIVNYTNVEYKGTVRDVKSSNKTIIKVIDQSKVASAQTTSGSPDPGGNPATPQKTNAGSSLSAGIVPTSTSTSTPEATPTPITPGFDIAFAVLILIFAAGLKRR